MPIDPNKKFTYDELREYMIEYLQTEDSSATEGLEQFLKMLDPNKEYTIEELRMLLKLWGAVEGED